MPVIRFGHSPDPDDAFMFYAIAKKKIDLRGFEVHHVVEDIESLNQRALKGELEATAISVHAYAYVADRYAILRSGASMGDRYGPIVVSKQKMGPKDLGGKKIAVPGMLTTAYLALRIFEKNFSYVVVPFDKILDYVESGRADAGLVIHEGQITYGRQKLHKVIDLGKWWWEKTKLPLPLGIDVVRKDLGPEQMRSFSKVFQESIVYSLEHRKDGLDYAAPFGRGLSRADEDRFVAMYVNDYTRDLGPKGEESIREILKHGFREKLLQSEINPEFV